MSSFRFAWRDRVEDENWLRWCACGHAEQHHDIGGCTVNSYTPRACICPEFIEKRREFVGVKP